MSRGKTRSLFSGIRSARAIDARADQHVGLAARNPSVPLMGNSHPVRTTPTVPRAGNGAPSRVVPRPTLTNKSQRKDIQGLFDTEPGARANRMQPARSKPPPRSPKAHVSQKSAPKSSLVNARRPPATGLSQKAMGQKPRQMVRSQAVPSAPQVATRRDSHNAQASGEGGRIQTAARGVKRSQSTMRMAHPACKSQQPAKSAKRMSSQQVDVGSRKGPDSRQIVNKQIQYRQPNGAPHASIKADQSRDHAKQNSKNSVRRTLPQGQPVTASVRGGYAGGKPRVPQGGARTVIDIQTAQNDSYQLPQSQIRSIRNSQPHVQMLHQEQPRQTQGLFSQVNLKSTARPVKRQPAPLNRAQVLRKKRAEEEEDDLDGFIADGDDSGDWKRELRKITRYDASRYQHIDDRDDPSMEVGWQRCQLEEHRSARSGREEDAREELMNLKRKHKRSF